MNVTQYLTAIQTKGVKVQRALKNYCKKLFYRLFVVGQKFGVSILPLHYYSPIPHVHGLGLRTDWKRPRSMRGILMRPVADQLTFLEQLLSSVPPIDEYDFHAQALKQTGVDGGYGAIESQVLAAFVVSQNIKKVIQVGCGVSTEVMLDSVGRQNRNLNITCIEPYPGTYLRRQSQERRISLVDNIAQLVDLELYTKLTAGDLLFIDSTHSVAPGSEVNRIILEILPRLEVGVWVHFHDIYFPYDYPRGFLSDDLFFSQETALLYAFLLQNSSFVVELSMSVLHYATPNQLKLLISKYDPQCNDEGLATTGGLHFPSSIFLKNIGLR
jgi:hypothetical protein